MNDMVAGAGWGIRPALFRVAGVPVPSYEVFVGLGLLAGVLLFFRAANREPERVRDAPWLLMAALFGGAIGAKLPVLVLHEREILAARDVGAALSGRTIVGGLIGATLAVILVRRRLGIRKGMGNLFAPGVAAGIGIGRIGCFLRGCCYGKATALPWGVDFGDHVLRHPTQLYESAFAFALFGWLAYASRRAPVPGALFRSLMIAYFSFRFLVEFVRAEPAALAGLTLAQWVSLGVLCWYLLLDRRADDRGRRTTDAAR
jgi:phosphatidylglycerol---prolipoprotein diacylglyceryl transferase